MTLPDAASMLNDGRAAKRPGWSGGYVYRTDTAQATDGSYTLTYKKADGTESVYSYNGTTGQWTAPATKLQIDAEFHASILANDWFTGKKADFEAARIGGGTW